MSRILNGDVLETLGTLDSDSIDCCVTSPPYWGLRDYGHDGQIGLEKTPQEFVGKMVDVFREVRRVLKPSGTCWVNLGDSYTAGGNGPGLLKYQEQSIGSATGPARALSSKSPPAGMRPKNLVGIPWRVAFALQDDGWYLRQDIIWSKPNPMPESVTDRCTKAHEYVFLLTKSERYFYDADAIKERAVSDHAPGNTSHKAATAYENGASEHRTKAGLVGFADRARNRRPQLRRALELAEEHGLTEAHIEAIRSGGITDTGKATVTQDGTGKNAEEIQRLMGEAKAALGGYYREFLIPDTRNKRSVWTIPTTPCKEAHFAVFPEELPRLCILAGSPEGGTVLDPFAGSGTTGAVAEKLGRHAVLIELNPDYIPLIEKRLSGVTRPLDLFAEASS